MTKKEKKITKNGKKRFKKSVNKTKNLDLEVENRA